MIIKSRWMVGASFSISKDPTFAILHLFFVLEVHTSVLSSILPCQSETCLAVYLLVTINCCLNCNCNFFPICKYFPNYYNTFIYWLNRRGSLIKLLWFFDPILEPEIYRWLLVKMHKFKCTLSRL